MAQELHGFSARGVQWRKNSMAFLRGACSGAKIQWRFCAAGLVPRLRPWRGPFVAVAVHPGAGAMRGFQAHPMENPRSERTS
jgi:hypothetical protein